MADALDLARVKQGDRNLSGAKMPDGWESVVEALP